MDLVGFLEKAVMWSDQGWDVENLIRYRGWADKYAG